MEKQAKNTKAGSNKILENTGAQLKTFSVADLWNIHRQRKPIVIR